MQGRKWHVKCRSKELWSIWFRRPEGGRPCAFEHVFVGEASQDPLGRGVVGGLHNWFKFSLEELGTMKETQARRPILLGNRQQI